MRSLCCPCVGQCYENARNRTEEIGGAAAESQDSVCGKNHASETSVLEDKRQAYSAMVTSTWQARSEAEQAEKPAGRRASTPGSMEMEVICLTTSAGECRSMRRLWMRSSKRSHVFVPARAVSGSAGQPPQP